MPGRLLRFTFQIVFGLNYSIVIACTGQAPSQAPQERQMSSLQTDFPSSSRSSASTGHVPTHAPHPTQRSLSIFAGISKFISPFRITIEINSSKNRTCSFPAYGSPLSLSNVVSYTRLPLHSICLHGCTGAGSMHSTRSRIYRC